MCVSARCVDAAAFYCGRAEILSTQQWFSLAASYLGHEEMLAVHRCKSARVSDARIVVAG